MADIFETIGDWLGLNKGKATIAAANENKGLINQLGDTGRPIIQGIQDTSGDYLDLGKQGAGLYADAMGLNGADGSTRATDAFTTSPGFEFGQQQGEQALMRNASALGKLQSGNTDVDLLQYGVKTGNDEWGDWLSRLNGYNDMYAGGVDRSNSAAGLGLDFESGLTSGLLGANNQKAAGKEAGQGALLDSLGSLAGIAGKAFGYGGFGGAPAASVNPRTNMPAMF